MKRLLTLFTVALLVLLPTLAFAEGGLQGNDTTQNGAVIDNAQPTSALPVAATSICAMGSATIPMVSDIIVITLSVSKSGSSVAQAQLATDEAIASLCEKLMGIEGVAAIAQNDIAYDGAKPLYRYQYGKLDKQETVLGYLVSARLTVTLQNKASMGAVLDVAIKNGAESSYRLVFQSSQTSVAYDEALSAATAEAVRKAKLLATASGLSLGTLQAVTELSTLSDQAASEASVVQKGSTPELNEAEADTESLQSALSVVAVVRVCYTAQQE